ncbi:MAG: hypothetical protein E4H01_08895 [Lysobacterales bacterium]|nr:MAG: hypothetical protein E4H01_08895 [Xanthomonadales bacterium]
MIKGMDKFRQHFEGFADQYVLIGGAASVLVMDEAGADFRATKDLDIVLSLEALDSLFVEAFWAFIKAGGYQNQQRSTGEKVFYRFDHPEDEGYPFMLELFSRKPDSMILGDDSHLTPIPTEEDVSSLSAILLSDDYYRFLDQHKHEIEGVPVVNEVGLIPLKAKAWLELTERHESGENIDSKKIKKHKSDVFRLFQILSPELRVELPESISQDMQNFFSALSEDAKLSIKDFGLKGLTVSDVVSTLRRIYGIKTEK